MAGQLVTISKVTVEHYETGLGVFHCKPRLTWRFGDAPAGWIQQSYELEVGFFDNHQQAAPEVFRVKSSQSVLVPWPARPLKSRDVAHVRVRVAGADGIASNWVSTTVEAALLERDDWQAELISGEKQDADVAKRPYYLRRAFDISAGDIRSGRLYVTAHGAYKVEINGQAVGDEVLAPGWQSYKHRLHYQTYDVSRLLRPGRNTVAAVLGEGWFATRLNFGGGVRNIWGSDLGLLLQLEVDRKVVVVSKADGKWEWAYGPIQSSEIYDGEVYDARLEDKSWSSSDTTSSFSFKKDVRSVGFPTGKLIAAESPPVRRTASLRAKQITTTPSGKTVLDFGENLVGWLRIDQDPAERKSGHEIIFRHAEVMEKEELGTRPLRAAKASERITCGSTTLVGYEPSFTFHGFRYVEVEGWPSISTDSVSAQFVHSDMERTGWFECSHPLINQLHSNVVRGLRGNFVSVPTDCPQRDERLGWTGDLQVFASTACFLYDTSSLLSGWLQDLAEEQIKDYNGIVPLVVPNTLFGWGPPPPSAIWGDVSVLAPQDLFTAYDDPAILEQQWESMVTWVKKGITRGPDNLWALGMQFGDWLDPKAPPDAPQDGRTDALLVSNAWLLHVTDSMARMAAILGKDSEAEEYSADYKRLLQAFQDEYITPNGRMVSDTQTALAIALHYGLLPKQHITGARDRLSTHIKKAIFKVATGFAGTPVILHALSDNDLLQLAYRMLQEKQCPSWLYTVSMGATTIWERWDSMLPDGTINPGEMTSFNHYALGSVASWLHKVVAGISPLTPGWKRTLFKPQPGGTITSASATHLSPYGKVSCSWRIEGEKLSVDIVIPPNTMGQIELPGVSKSIGSGNHSFSVKWENDPSWPPKSMQIPFAPPQPDEPA